MKLHLKTTPVRYHPSQLMHWWTRFITLSITWTWVVVWHFVLQKFLVWGYVSLPNVSETLSFSNSPIKKITRQQIWWTGWPRNAPINVIIFGVISKANAQWTAKHRSIILLNGIPSWIYSQLSFHVLSRMPKYHINQNDLMLSNPVYRTPNIAHGVCSSPYINERVCVTSFFSICYTSITTVFIQRWMQIL